MKALVYRDKYDVRIEDKPVPEVQHPEDIILKVTTTALCGSDLHLYHGTIPTMEAGQTLGHEFMGIVESIGSEVHEVKPGDRVVIPFNISCGKCWFCRHQKWSQCDRSNPNAEVGAAYGYSRMMGGYDGGQAEYVRVPYGNTNPLLLPDSVSDEQAIFLSDILPTGFFGVEITDMKPGDDVAVFGAGPVGYFAVMSAFLMGAAKVFVVDREPDRLALCENLGAEPINFDDIDPVEYIKDATHGKGAICVDAVGYEAVGHHPAAPKMENPAYEKLNPIQVIEWVSQAARKYSTVGIPGVYIGTFDKFPFGQLFSRELNIRMGQCPVKNYNEQLLRLIEVGRIDPTKLISHSMDLDDAPRAYEMFDKKEEGFIKVIFKM